MLRTAMLRDINSSPKPALIVTSEGGKCIFKHLDVYTNLRVV